MKSIAIVPARIGSKSIKEKNLIKINGISIIEKTILSLKKNKWLDCIAISTDSKKIQRIANKNKVWCESLRPKKISGDNAKTNDAVSFVLKNINEKFDFVFEIHPTYYFRDHKDLDGCYRKVRKNKYESIITVSEISTCAHRDYQTKIINGKLKFNKLPHTFNKFKLSKSFEYNGYIIGSSYKNFLKFNSHFKKNQTCGFYVINKKKTLIDLNDAQDLKIIRAIAK